LHRREAPRAPVVLEPRGSLRPTRDGRERPRLDSADGPHTRGVLPAARHGRRGLPLEGGRLEGAGALTTGETLAYIFDFDGTLGTIPVDWEGVKEGLQSVTGEDEFKQIFARLGDIIAKNPKLARPTFRVLDEFEAAAAPSVRLYEGTVGLLSRLSASAKVSIVTFQGLHTCSQMLER